MCSRWVSCIIPCMWGVWICRMWPVNVAADLLWSWWRPLLLPGWAAEGRANSQPIREGGAKATSQWASTGWVLSKRHNTSVSICSLLLDLSLDLSVSQVDWFMAAAWVDSQWNPSSVFRQQWATITLNQRLLTVIVVFKQSELYSYRLRIQLCYRMHISNLLLFLLAWGFSQLVAWISLPRFLYD